LVIANEGQEGSPTVRKDLIAAAVDQKLTDVFNGGSFADIVMAQEKIDYQTYSQV
jgi:hypothetical protein